MSNTTNTAAEASTAALTTLFTLPIHFKRWAEGSKGHKELLALAETGSIADFDQDVERIEEDGAVAFKRKSLTFNVPTLDCSVALANLVESGDMTAAQVEHAQELINQAIKKEVQTIVADEKRTLKTPLTDDNCPTWETVLAQPFNKRPVAIKVTAKMVEAATKLIAEYMVAAGIGEGGRELTVSLCTKKFSIAALNAVPAPVLEKVSGIVTGWYETLTEAQQQEHFAVVNLWDTNIEAKLNPKQENITVDMF